MGPVLSLNALLAVTLSNPAAAATEYELPADKLSCLVENQQKYINLPRPFIKFLPEACPAIDGEEAAWLAQNSAEGGAAATFVFMRKGDFACLIKKIDAYLAETGGTAEAERVTFQLDCP